MSSNNETGNPITTSVASIAAGSHNEREIVAVTGTALNRQHWGADQGSLWANFTLTDGDAEIEVQVSPKAYQRLKELVSTIPAPQGSDQPEPGQPLAVSGHVCRCGPTPKLTAFCLHIKFRDE